MTANDLESNTNEEEVNFLPAQKPILGNDIGRKDTFGPLLTREELLRLDSEEPIWRRIRMILMAVFWVLWLGLLAAAIIIIVLTPKCPPTPKLSFWQSKVGYWVDPFSFVDSGDDLIGDLQGLISRIGYIKDTVGAGFIILGSFVSGHYTNAKGTLGLVENFTEVDKALGTMEDFRSMIKAYHKSGMEVVVTLDYNAIAHSHPWTKLTSRLQPAMINPMVSRDGSPATVTLSGEKYYSVRPKDTVDLNLTSSEVVESLLNVVDHWLGEGVDGILLANAAFYVEEDGEVPQTTLVEPGTQNNWFEVYPSNQLFTNGSVEFIVKMRERIDQISSATGRPRLLAIDAGDVGYGLQDVDESVNFLGSENQSAAHLVIGRQFVKRRGWKSTPSEKGWEVPSIRSYGLIPKAAKSSLALSTATPSDQRHNDFVDLASIFLLPGTPLLYYGSELAIKLNSSTVSPTTMYPKGKVPFPNLSARDSQLVCQLPMPWDRSGFEFSSAAKKSTFSDYLDQFGIEETVESALSFGRGYTPFRMVQDLIKLRKKPSISWGDFESIQLDLTINNGGVELFTRRATGFPAFIVALIKQTPNYGGVFDFTSICNRVAPRMTYPPRPELTLDKSVDSGRIYLKTDREPAVYVFECT